MTTRERRRQARALWEKACATMECSATGSYVKGCAATADSGWSWDFLNEESRRASHLAAASALLDGLDVRDLP